MVHCFGHAAAGLVFGWENIQPLHHADVLMGKTVAMHHETSHRVGIEIGAEGDRSELHILVEVWLIGIARKSCGLRLSTGHKDGVVPLGCIELYAIDMSEQ